jgi:hypothetical protein
MELGMTKANTLLDAIDYTDPDKHSDYNAKCITNMKRRKLDNLVNKINDENVLTVKVTLALALGVMTFAFGHWPYTNDKHNMTEAASEFAAEVVTMASELKSERDTLFDGGLLVQKMDDKDIKPE